jgi:integrase
VTEPVRRQRRRILTDKMVAALPRKRRRYTRPDPEQRGMYVRVAPQGPAVYVVVCRDVFGRQLWTTLGNADELPIERAREQAREVLQRVKAGLPAVEPPPVKPDTFADVAENWLRRHVAAKGLRTQLDIERRLRRHVYPFWGKRAFTSLKRSDIAGLLDHVEDGSGKHEADYVLAIVRSISNWFAARNDGYSVPFVRGMRRVDPKTRARSRSLSDDELRKVWKAAEASDNAFGAFVQLAVLTAQRRSALVRMKWDAISPDGVWKMPVEERAKGVGGDLKLPPLALKIIRRQKKFASNPYVLAGRSTGPFNGFAKAKTALDQASKVTGWRIHDLRRTARSLLSRAGVISEHAERVLGHARGVIEATYDVHDFAPEKATALAKLAALVERIVNPPKGRVVVPMRPQAGEA